MTRHCPIQTAAARHLLRHGFFAPTPTRRPTMPDATTLPTPAQAVDLVAAFRAWQSADPTTGPDEPMAAALFAAFPGESPYDDERCVTVDGYALVAKRERRPDGTETFDLDHYALDGRIEARGPATRPQPGGL